uniref:Glucuronosyltransferase n=1 Tax=Heterorhabditis bacteriophora TaxID=37862 RepID=A0A1I7WQ72_HETBA
MGNIADTLHEAGHNVTVLQPIADEDLKSGCKKARVLTTPKSKKVDKLFTIMSKGLADSWISNAKDPFSLMETSANLRNIFMYTCEC